MKPEKKAKSPYQRYGKVPFRYSPEIYACIKACREGRNADYRRNHDAFWALYEPELRRHRIANGMGG